MKYEIKNIAGIDCIFAPMQDSNSITIEILVKAGSIYETQKTNGLSHFLEHMFFKGGKKYPTKKDVAATLDEIGADYNAFTSNEHAGYYVKSAPEFRETGIDVLADMFLHATFLPEEIDKERSVILEEIKSRNDIPPAKLYIERSRKYYGDNSYGWSILGPEENILSFTQEDFFAHKKQLYTKDNMVIIVAGKIVDLQKLEEIIENTFVALPDEKNYSLIPYKNIHPLGQEDIIHKNIEQANILFGAPGSSGKGILHHQYELLANIVGGTTSSRLYEEIRENKGLAYSIYAGHYPQSDHGYFYVNAGLTKEKYQEGIDAIKAILQDIAQGNITDQEFTKAKNNIIGSLQMGLETSNEVASFLGRQYLFYKNIESIEDMIASFNSITLDQIKDIAPIMHPDNFYGCVML